MSVKTLRINFKPLTERGFSVEERIAAIKVALKNRYGIMIGFNVVSLKGRVPSTVVENVVFTAHHFDEEKLTLTGEWLDDHPQAKVLSHFDPERDLVVTLGYLHRVEADGKIVVTDCFASGDLAVAAIVELSERNIGDWEELTFVNECNDLTYVEPNGAHWSGYSAMRGYAMESILQGNVVGYRESNGPEDAWTFVRGVGRLDSDDYRIVECRPDASIIMPEKQYDLMHFANRYYFTVLNTKIPCEEICEDEIER